MAATTTRTKSLENRNIECYKNLKKNPKIAINIIQINKRKIIKIS